MPSVLGNIGHKVILAGHEGSHMPYPVMDQVKGISVYARLFKKKYRMHSTALINRKYDERKLSKIMHEYLQLMPIIICSFPTSMCEM